MHQGDVYAFLKANNGKLSEEMAVAIVLEPFIAGIHSLHARGLIHRDIKPENILFNSSYRVKIADFGLSIDSKQEIANTRCAALGYLLHVV
jgi:aurora kinase